MAKTRPVVALAFGKRLAHLRGHASHQAVANRLATIGVRVSPSTLWHYEHGTVAAPDPRVLWGYGQLFDADLEELAALLVGRSSTTGRRAELTEAEAECVRAFRRLSDEDRAWLRNTLNRLGDTSESAAFRHTAWDGTNRRSGHERREAS